MATKKATEKKAFKMEQVFAMWRKDAKSGNHFFTGSNGNQKLVGFYNTMKKNPKEPDIRIYLQDEEGKAGDEYCSLWVNTSKNDKTYLSGAVDGKKVVGFINNGKNEKAPYFSCYYSDSEPKKKDEAPQEAEASKEKLPF